MSTVSENLFDDYCANRGYAVEELAAGSALGKTPDRMVTTPLGQVVVEIKELTPSEDDLRQFRELEEQKWTHGGGTAGARAFEMIRRAAPQLKRYADRKLPCVLDVSFSGRYFKRHVKRSRGIGSGRAAVSGVNGKSDERSSGRMARISFCCTDWAAYPKWISKRRRHIYLPPTFT